MKSEFDELIPEELRKAIALKIFLNEPFFIEIYEGTPDDRGDLIEPIEGDEERDNYMVLTDEEADEKWEQSLDNYIEECIYPELKESFAHYFDVEKWKTDARYDGRGHAISSYDGRENEIKVAGTYYYLYRIN